MEKTEKEKVEDDLFYVTFLVFRSVDYDCFKIKMFTIVNRSKNVLKNLHFPTYNQIILWNVLKMRENLWNIQLFFAL